MPYPTPILPITEGEIARTVVLPNNALLLAAITDGLVNPTIEENWLTGGAEIAQIMLKMLNTYFLSTDVFSIGRIEFFPVAPPNTHLPLDGSTYAQADYPLLVPKIPASWLSGSDFTLPDTENKYLRLSSTPLSEGGRDNFTLTPSDIPLMSIDYIGADPIALEITVGIPAPAAIPVPLVTTVGSASPNSIDLDPTFVTLIPAIFARFPQ